MAETIYRGVRDDKLLFEDTASLPKHNAIVPCLMCTKPMIMLPFIGEPDQTCPECSRTYGDTAKVICRRCRVTIGRIPAGRRMENGYYVRPKSVLHSDRCNICQPGLTESTILEVDEWQRMMRPKKIIVGGRI